MSRQNTSAHLHIHCVSLGGKRLRTPIVRLISLFQCFFSFHFRVPTTLKTWKTQIRFLSFFPFNYFTNTQRNWIAARYWRLTLSWKKRGLKYHSLHIFCQFYKKMCNEWHFLLFFLNVTPEGKKKISGILRFKSVVNRFNRSTTMKTMS